MNKPLLLLVLLFTPLLQAEPPAAIAPKAVPFALQAPSVSSWAIQIKQKGDRGDKPAAASAPGIEGGPMIHPQTSVLNQIKIDKADNIRSIVRKWSDGKSVETWWFGPLCFEEYLNNKGDKEIRVINTSAVPGAIVDTGRLSGSLASGGDYQQTDFPELSWIKSDMLVGTEEKDETSYRVYRMSSTASASRGFVDPTRPKSGKDAKPSAPSETGAGSTAAEPTVTKEAWINASTKLPHKLVDGGSTWTYSFTNGNASLALPASCNEALQRYMLALESAKYRRLP